MTAVPNWRRTYANSILESDRMPDDMEVLRRVYDLFNRRDIESVLAAMQPDVIWANGMEGGHMHGR